MNLETVLQDYKDRTHLRHEGDDYYLIMPFFHRYSDDSIQLHFYTEGEMLYLSDCGDTHAYLMDRYVDRAAFHDRIEGIKKRFFLKETEAHALVLEFPSDQIFSIERFIGFFIQGVTLIANVDLV